jgi:hypothetical protein
MGDRLSAQEITEYLQRAVGRKPGSWAGDRVFLESKLCALCGKEFRPWMVWKRKPKTISIQIERGWNAQLCCSQSCAKKLKNPMSNSASILKMKAKLKEIRHRPIKRGGNGQLLPLPQLALLHALGEGWEAEFPVATKMRHLKTGMPTCYKIDLANKEKMIAIEVDGTSHCPILVKSRDVKKTDFLVSQGWSVYRVSNAKALELYTTFKSQDTLLTLLTEG